MPRVAWSSLPFQPGTYKRIAVKIIDDKDIERIKIVEIGYHECTHPEPEKKD